MSSPTASYDVFDTVLTRTFAHPRDLFVHVGATLRARKVAELDPRRFAEHRWAAELEARKRSSYKEVLIDDIYRVLGERARIPPATCDAIKKVELEIEAKHIRGVPRIRERIAHDRARCGRLVFLSDMYLPARVLGPWLAREGMLAPDDLLLISGEARGNKSSGGLFQIARMRTDGDFANWHHIGDHPFADVAKPRELGIAATHFIEGHLTPRERRVRNSGGEFAETWRSFLAGAMRLARLGRAPASEREAVLWETGATVAGPLFYGFVRWTLQEARRRGIRRLYFLARDGQILWRVARELQQPGDGTPECIYLQGSRLAFAGPAELAAPTVLRELTAATGHYHSLRQVTAQLGLGEAWIRANLPTSLAIPDIDANLPQPSRDALADWLLAPAQRAAIEAAVTDRAEKARSYLKQERFSAGEPIGIVDAGWLGSIQRNLERIIGTPTDPAPVTGFYIGLMPPQPPLSRGEMLGYANTFSPLPLLREESHKVLIELMAQSDQGQVTGFKNESGRWVAETKDIGPVNLVEVRLFQEAILEFARRMAQTISETDFPEEAFHAALLGNYREFHDNPTVAEARVLGTLPHADQLYEQKHAPLCAQPSTRELIAMLRDFRCRPPHWWIGGEAALGHSTVLRLFRAMKRVRWKLGGRQE